MGTQDVLCLLRGCGREHTALPASGAWPKSEAECKIEESIRDPQDADPEPDTWPAPSHSQHSHHGRQQKGEMVGVQKEERDPSCPLEPQSLLLLLSSMWNVGCVQERASCLGQGSRPAESDPLLCSHAALCTGRCVSDTAHTELAPSKGSVCPGSYAVCFQLLLTSDLYRRQLERSQVVFSPEQLWSQAWVSLGVYSDWS